MSFLSGWVWVLGFAAVLGDRRATMKTDERQRGRMRQEPAWGVLLRPVCWL